jgi:hypothetical protein
MSDIRALCRSNNHTVGLPGRQNRALDTAARSSDLGSAVDLISGLCSLTVSNSVRPLLLAVRVFACCSMQSPVFQSLPTVQILVFLCLPCSLADLLPVLQIWQTKSQE